eukprot:355362-Chlamydomonas_euryale.AAC.2
MPRASPQQIGSPARPPPAPPPSPPPVRARPPRKAPRSSLPPAAPAAPRRRPGARPLRRRCASGGIGLQACRTTRESSTYRYRAPCDPAALAPAPCPRPAPAQRLPSTLCR